MKTDKIIILFIFGFLLELIFQEYLLALGLFIVAAIIITRNCYVSNDFKCKRCAKCCSLKVTLSKEDIKRIKKSGKKDFMDGKFLKRTGKKINAYS